MMNNDYSILTKIKCFLIDLDGTIYLDNVLFDNVKETLNAMRKQGRVIFLTNNSSRSKEEYLAKLNKLGIIESDEEVYTSSMATCEYLNEFYPNSKIHLMGTKALQKEFEGYQIKLDDNNPDIIVLSYDKELNYDKLVKFTNFIHEGKYYIATHPDINCPASPYYVIDTGAMMKMIEASTNKLPDVYCQ